MATYTLYSGRKIWRQPKERGFHGNVMNVHKQVFYFGVLWKLWFVAIGSGNHL